MASYGVFLAACGYEYHGPKGHLAFAPRLTPENFRAAFTTAEGWGTFCQKRDGQASRKRSSSKWGKLRLRSLAFALAGKGRSHGGPRGGRRRMIDGRNIASPMAIRVELDAETTLQAGQKLEVTTTACVEDDGSQSNSRGLSPAARFVRMHNPAR